MKGYGRIRNISVKEGFGFAEFDDRRDADDAVKVIFLKKKNSGSINPQNGCHPCCMILLCRIWTGRTLTGEGSELSTLEATGGMMATAMVAGGEAVGG